MSFGLRLDRMFVIMVFQILLTDKFSQMCQINNSVRFYFMFSNNSTKIPKKVTFNWSKKIFQTELSVPLHFSGYWNWKEKNEHLQFLSVHFQSYGRNLTSHFFPKIFEQLLENTRTRTITHFMDILQHSEVQMTFTHSCKFGT